MGRYYIEHALSYDLGEDGYFVCDSFAPMADIVARFERLVDADEYCEWKNNGNNLRKSTKVR